MKRPTFTFLVGILPSSTLRTFLGGTIRKKHPVAFFQVPSTLHSSHLDSKSLLPHPGHLFPLRCPEKFTQGELRMLASSASPPTTLLTKKQGVGRSHPPCPSPRPCWTCLASAPADQACPARSRPQNFSGCATLPSPAIRCSPDSIIQDVRLQIRRHGNEKDV